MDKLLSKIQIEAMSNGMETYIVGSRAHFDPKSDIWIPDGRLLKICPIGVKRKVLLEIDNVNSGGRYKLYSHRTGELTRKYRGKYVSVEWIIGFIKNSSKLAKSISEESKKAIELSNKNTPSKVQVERPEPEEIVKKKTQRVMVDCRCNVSGWLSGEA